MYGRQITPTQNQRKLLSPCVWRVWIVELTLHRTPTPTLMAVAGTSLWCLVCGVWSVVYTRFISRGFDSQKKSNAIKWNRAQCMIREPRRTGFGGLKKPSRSVWYRSGLYQFVVVRMRSTQVNQYVVNARRTFAQRQVDAWKNVANRPLWVTQLLDPEGSAYIIRHITRILG